MHRRTLFLHRERTGSTFINSMLLGRPGEFAGDVKMFKNIEYPTWLTTDPPEQCKFWHGSCPNVSILEDLIQSRPVIHTDEAYFLEMGPLDPSFFTENYLSPGSWRFFRLFRDPRNRIESLLTRGRLDKRRQIVFENECYASAQEVSEIVRMYENPQYRVIKFEELIQNPLSVCKYIFDFMGLSIDDEFYQNIISSYTKDYVNSSFDDAGKSSNNRWSKWFDEEKSYYDIHVMPVIIKLANKYERFAGYTKW